LGPDQPFYGLEAPGLDGEQQPLTRIQDMAAHHIREIREVQADGPYFLGGLSMGGLVAFEIAQQLYAQNQAVAALILMDTYRPQQHRTVRHWGNRSRRLLIDNIFGRMVFHGRNLFQLSAPQRSTYTRDKTMKLGKSIAAKLRLDHQGIQAHLGDVYAVKVRKANLQAMRKYRPQCYPGRITLLITSDSLDRQHESGMGWAELARAGIDFHVVPGDHSTMLSEAHIGAMGLKLRECLQTAQSSAIR
jgi:thioesterase domain-containing protein